VQRPGQLAAPRFGGLGKSFPCNEFYDYKAKYIDDRSELIIPAPLSPSLTEEVRSLAVKTFLALNCFGLGRVDFFVNPETEEIYVNEINTIPGFTSISMYPKLWEASGLPYPRLIDELIELALERHQAFKVPWPPHTSPYKKEGLRQKETRPWGLFLC
jgi:D-alanine-D-alanine ligase